MNIKLNNQIIELLPSTHFTELRKQQPNAEWWQKIIDFLEEWSNNLPYVYAKTSGSTGTPKQIKCPKEYLLASAKQTCDFFQLNEHSTALLCLSADYIAGKMMLVRAIVSQMNLFCVEPSSYPIKDVNSEIDFVAMVSMQVEESVKDMSKFNLLKNIIIGGSKVSDKLADKLHQYRGAVFETFGMTETYSHIALRQLQPNKQDYFIPLNGVSVSKSDINTLIIDCPNIGVNKLQTNDVIELKNKGFKWLGRQDFIINTGGIKVNPEQIENKISSLISKPFVIVGKPDAKLGEKVILLIEGKEFEISQLYESLKNNLSKYETPKEIVFIDNLPLTASGKINRRLVNQII